MSGRFGIVLYMLFEGFHGFVVLPEMVFGCTEDTVQLCRMRVAQAVGMADSAFCATISALSYCFFSK